MFTRRGEILGQARAAAALLLGAAAAASADQGSADETATEEILQILQDRGLIDEAEHLRLMSKYEKERQASLPRVGSALAKMEWYGDLRLRYETLRFQHDETGFDETNRERFRYRGRIGFNVPINDWVKVGMRFVSGQDDERSTNQTLGRGPDFDTDDFRFDRAFAEIKLPTGDLKTTFIGGKMSNPFRWKVGKDFIVWDSDVSPEGGALRFSYAPTEGWELFSNVAYYIDDENTSSSDPKVIPLQAGFHADVDETIRVGGRGSMYWWRSLDSAFITRTEGFGNLCSAFDACTGDPTAPGDDGKARIGEVSAYVQFTGLEDWPITVYGTGVKNFTADSETIATNLGTESVDDEDTAWMVGLEVGDKKLAKLGFGYAKVEANSVISTLTDSDLFDGYTNREGWVAYFSKNLLPHTDLNVTLFRSNEIEDGDAFDACRPDCGAYTNSVEDSKRYRLQTDLVFKF